MTIDQARIRKTELYVHQPFEFFHHLEKDLAALERKAKREGYKPCEGRSVT